MTLLEILEKRRRDSIKAEAESRVVPEFDVTKVAGYTPPQDVIIPRFQLSTELEQYEAVFDGCVDF